MESARKKASYDLPNLTAASAAHQYQRTVVARLGVNLTIKDRTIEFTPNKYFIPIEKMNEQMSQLENMVRTENNDAQKSKNTPVGVLALPDESTSTSDLYTSWLRRLDSNQRPID